MLLKVVVGPASEIYPENILCFLLDASKHKSGASKI